MPRQYTMGGRASGPSGGAHGAPTPATLRERFGALKNLPPFIKLVWQTCPALTLSNLCLRLLRALLPVVMLYIGKLIIDQVVGLVQAGVVAHELGAAWSSGQLDPLGKLLLLEFALAVASDVSGRVVSLIDSLLSERFNNTTSVRLMEHATIKTTDMTKAMGMVEGVYATSPVLEAKEFTTGKPFLEKYIEAYKKPPDYGGHYSYDSTYVLSAVIQKAKSADPKAITKAMHSINGYAPVIGTMTWDDKGEQRYGAVGVYELRSGSWELRMRSDRW